MLWGACSVSPGWCYPSCLRPRSSSIARIGGVVYTNHFANGSGHFAPKADSTPAATRHARAQPAMFQLSSLGKIRECSPRP